MSSIVFVAKAVLCDHSVILGAWLSFKGLIDGVELGVRLDRISKIDREINVYMLPLGMVQADACVAKLHFDGDSHKARIEWINGHSLDEVTSWVAHGVPTLWCPDCGTRQVEGDCRVCGAQMQREPTEGAERSS